MAALVDTNILVYLFDPGSPEKQRKAASLLEEGMKAGTLRIAHQAIVEFVSAVTRPIRGGEPLLAAEDARREAEELLAQFEILYPDENVVRTALRGAATYQLAWYDAHMWAYAEQFGLAEIYSEDFEHGRLYGQVRVVNPFA
ncbi:MAG: PIN domain-containing protein [Planctomycetes bacterium]|nr:PIN domain-containing protein [Planctomycetota bacterium]